MKKRFVLTATLALAALILTACGGQATAPEIAIPVIDSHVAPSPEAPVADVEVEAPNTEGRANPNETLVDEQGAVAVSVTPLNLEPDVTSLDFEVALNTHSVDLSMNLAEMAMLSTDTGATVAAVNWDAPLGGHHVTGVLSFPATSAGAAVLEGATTVILTVENLDAPLRTFTWHVN